MNEAKEIKSNTVWSLLQELSTKKGITEIAINGPKGIFVERDGQFIQLNTHVTKNDMYQFIKEVAEFNKRPCDDQHPLMDGVLPDGSRINVVMEPYAHSSAAITIRKYLRNLRTLEGAANAFGIEAKILTLIKAIAASRLNIIVSGGTGVGKTTMMNMLLRELPLNERIVVIEDTIELDSDHPNIVRLEAKASINSGKQHSISICDLVKNSLRMRPDRLIIGEVRGPELFDLLQAMNTGHDGSMSSLHANSVSECLMRMENLYLMNGMEVPLGAIRQQISSAINFIFQLGRDRDGKRRIIEIAEITGMEGATIQLQWIARFEKNHLSLTGTVPECMALLNERSGLALDFFS